MAKTFINHAKLSNEGKCKLLEKLPQQNIEEAADNSQRLTYIESLGVYLPSKAIDTEEVLKGCKRDVTFPLERMTGIRSRPIVEEGEYAIDLAKKAIENCLAGSNFSVEDIELLISCSISKFDGLNRFSYEPSTSLKLKDLFGFKNALAFDITNACAGMFTGIYIADAYIKAGIIRRGMVVSGEYITHLMHTAQKEIVDFMDPRLACLTLGDAGAAIILDRSLHNEVGFHEIELYTLGRYASLCIAKPTDREHGGAIMYTDTVRSSSVAIRHAVRHAAYILARQGWSPETFQHLIMHQTSETALKGAVNEINRYYNQSICHNGNVIFNLADRGNTASTSHFVALWDNITNNRINSGEKVIFGISGSGQTVGTALYTFDDLPDRIRRMKHPRSIAKRNRVTISSSAARAKTGVHIECIGVIPNIKYVRKETIELLKKAAESCIDKSRYLRNDIDLLIYAGVYRSEFISEPAIAAFLAGVLEINDDIESPWKSKTLAFDISNSSLGFLNACHVATTMIQSKKTKVVMIVASDIENNDSEFPRLLRGICETGSAVILHQIPNNNRGFGQFIFKDYTDYIDKLSAYTCHDRAGTYLHIEKSREIEDVFLKCIQDTIVDLLKVEDLDISEIKWVFPPQISTAFITKLSDRTNIDIRRIIDVVADGRDYFTSSVPYGIQHARDNNLVDSGDIGLIIGVGAGVSVGSMTYYF